MAQRKQRGGTNQSCWFEFQILEPLRSSVLAVAVHQRYDEHRDVVPGAQALIGDPPASVPQHAPRSHDQVLRCHCIPERQQQNRECR